MATDDRVHDGVDGWWLRWFVGDRPASSSAREAAVVAAVAIVQVAGTLLYGSDEPGRWAFDGFAAALLVAGPVALVLRRRWPEATLVATFLFAAGYAATGYPRGPVGYPAFGLALVSAVLLGHRRFAWAVAAVAFPAFALLPSVVPDALEAERGLWDQATILFWLPLAGAAAEVTRVRLERRAERAAAARLDARRRASEERLAIARELHDVLAHNISLINVRSGVALHLLDDQPEHARPALAAINEASEEALGELRAVLDVLSRGLDRDGESGGTWAPRVPTAGLRDIEALVHRTRAAGLDVDLVVQPADPRLATSSTNGPGNEHRTSDGEAVDAPDAAPGVGNAEDPSARTAAGGDRDGESVDARGAAGAVRGGGDAVARTAAGGVGGGAGVDVGGGVGGRGGAVEDRLSLPAEVDLAAFRIVQEALTNVVRHAGAGARATVRLVRAPHELVVEVDDDGRGAGSAGGQDGGRGIAGMCERARALGGTCAAGARPGRGFRVRAQLPVGDPAR